MPRDYSSKELSGSMEYSLQQAGYNLENQISRMTIKDALISLTVAILMGINPEKLEITDIVWGELSQGEDDNYAEWDMADIETARTLFTVIGASSGIKDAKVPSGKATFTALMAQDLPPKSQEVSPPISIDEILTAYQLAIMPPTTIN